MRCWRPQDGVAIVEPAVDVFAAFAEVAFQLPEAGGLADAGGALSGWAMTASSSRRRARSKALRATAFSAGDQRSSRFLVYGSLLARRIVPAMGVGPVIRPSDFLSRRLDRAPTCGRSNTALALVCDEAEPRAEMSMPVGTDRRESGRSRWGQNASPKDCS
jgi:hypothetical protein